LKAITDEDDEIRYSEIPFHVLKTKSDGIGESRM